MRAVEIAAFGGPEGLRLVERPDPVPGEDEVLIQVRAAGVNRPDLVQRQGKYPPPPGASDLPGLEVAGVVVGVGPTQEPGRWTVGDRVMALVAGGGYAELVAAPAGQCLPVPAPLSDIEAAGIPETFFTVWSNVFDRGRLTAGDAFLVHGGSSGIGTTAIQLAKAFGAHVFATAGTPEKCAACVALGAERAIHYPTEDFVAVVKALTGGAGVDVILDMVGGPYTPRNIAALAMDGRLLQIAIMGGATGTVDLARLMTRRLTITGSTLRPRSVAEKAAIARHLEASVWPLIEQRRIRPLIHATFPLADASRAHEVLEEGAHIGKVILVV